MPSRTKSPGKLRTLHLVAVIFFTVSGGPYGLESLFAYVGNHGALLLLLITPLLWDVPHYPHGARTQQPHARHRRLLSMGQTPPSAFAGPFFEGWWTWLYTFCDLAIYPVLFVTYASFFVPAIADWKIPVCLLSSGLPPCSISSGSFLSAGSRWR